MTIDTLVGYPEIYGNTIICLEGSNTDGYNYIEIWDIIDNKIKLNSKFSLNECDIFPEFVFLSDINEIMIIDSKNNFWKIKLD